MNPGPRLVPLGVMSARLGVASRDLRQAALAGDVPAIPVGKDGLLFEPEAVEAALLKCARYLRPEGERDGEAADGC